MDDDNENPPPPVEKKTKKTRITMNLDSDSESSDDDSGSRQEMPAASEDGTNWENPFYKFAITLLKQFIRHNIQGGAVKEEDVNRLANDIMVRLFYTEKGNINAILIQLTKHILVLRYAKEARFSSFLKALNDTKFYENTQMTSEMVWQAVNNVLYERFGIDLFTKAKMYITMQYERRRGIPKNISVSYPTDNDALFPSYEYTGISEGNMPWISKTQIESSRNTGMALGGGGAVIDKAENEKIQIQQQKNKETLAKIMQQNKPQKKKEGFFQKDTSKVAQMQRQMEQEEKNRTKTLLKTTYDKTAEARDKVEKEYKSKFFINQKIKVYRSVDKKWYPASIMEVDSEGLLVKYEENNSEILIPWTKILNPNLNLIKIETVKDKREFLSTNEAMRKGGGLSPEFLSTNEAMRNGEGLSPTCPRGKCDTCSMVIEQKPFQSYKKKGKGKNQEFTYLMFCSVGCMEKKKF